MQHEFVSSAEVDRIVPSSASPLVSQYSFPPPIHKCSDKTAVTLSPTPVSFEDEDPVAIENRRLYFSRLALQYQKIADRYEFYLSQLQDAEREAETNSQQNANIRRTNDEFYRRLNHNSAKRKYRNPMTGECPLMWLLDDHFRCLSLAEPSDEASLKSMFGFQDNRLGRKCPSVDDKRLMLPKSISIRSTGYLKIHQKGGSSSESNPTTLVMKVRVGGAEKKDGEEAEDAVELDVYSQGMFKTELCNKWQETGQCPYGKHCHFAHGIGELRPIIQHPRYKTELCHTVLIGDN